MKCPQIPLALCKVYFSLLITDNIFLVMQSMQNVNATQLKVYFTSIHFGWKDPYNFVVNNDMQQATYCWLDSFLPPPSVRPCTNTCRKLCWALIRTITIWTKKTIFAKRRRAIMLKNQAHCAARSETVITVKFHVNNLRHQIRSISKLPNTGNSFILIHNTRAGRCSTE